MRKSPEGAFSKYYKMALVFYERSNQIIYLDQMTFMLVQAKSEDLVYEQEIQSKDKSELPKMGKGILPYLRLVK